MFSSVCECSIVCNIVSVWSRDFDLLFGDSVVNEYFFFICYVIVDFILCDHRNDHDLFLWMSYSMIILMLLRFYGVAHSIMVSLCDFIHKHVFFLCTIRSLSCLLHHIIEQWLMLLKHGAKCNVCILLALVIVCAVFNFSVWWIRSTWS